MTKVAALKAKGFDVAIKDYVKKKKKKKSKSPKKGKSMAKKKKKKSKTRRKSKSRRRSRRSKRPKMVTHRHAKGVKEYKRKTKVRGTLKGVTLPIWDIIKKVREQDLAKSK